MQTQCKQGVEGTLCNSIVFVLRGEVQKVFAIFFLQAGHFLPVLSQTLILTIGDNRHAKSG